MTHVAATSSRKTQRASDPLEPVRSGKKALERGDKGPAVMALQKALNRHGAKLDVDGDFGPRTEAAVRGFQRSHGLEVDGVVGEKTAGKLRSVDRTQQSARADALEVGDRGKKVLAAEKQLKHLGYDPGAVDGKYDEATARAVGAFKRDQPELSGSGRKLGGEGQRSLQAESRALNHDPQRGRVKPTTARTRLDTATATAAGKVDDEGNLGIGRGDEGRVVKNVQAHLKAAGYDPAHVDGKFDERTEGALKAFQRRSGLPASGRVDAATWGKLKNSTIEARGPASPAQAQGERSAAVKRTEKALDRLGRDPGRVDGLFTEKTEKAVRAWEKKNPGANDGKVDAAELRLMEKQAKNTFVRPIDARLTSSSEFGMADAEGAPSARGGRYHAAKDWFAPGGSTVKSPVEGRVVEVRASSGNTGQVFGGTVKVQAKDGKVWVFRHVDPRNVRVGQEVNAGQPIARVTNWRDGPDHAHIELWKSLGGGYRFENMLDPMKYLSRFL